MRSIALLPPLALLLACQSEQRTPAPPPAPTVDSAQLVEARATADALGADLMTMLTGELKRGGPEAAIAICADSAQARTLAHEQNGISVRRVGTRVRNPRNAPDPLEQAVLTAFETSLLAGQLPADTVIMESLEGGGSRLRYLRPVQVQEGCLACHGAPEGIPSAVRAVLAERYPDDKATGYQVGELRGAVSVRVERQ
jgi:hypothetical protein